MSDGFGDYLQQSAQNSMMNWSRDIEAAQMENIIAEQQEMINELQGQLSTLRDRFLELREYNNEFAAREQSLIETLRDYVAEGVIDRDEFNARREPKYQKAKSATQNSF